MLNDPKNKKLILAEKIWVLSMLSVLLFSPLVSGKQHDNEYTSEAHDEYQKQTKHTDSRLYDQIENDHEDHEESKSIKISPEQQKLAGITVEELATQEMLSQTISAPGEVVNDLYNTTLLSVQVDSKVLSRQVVLGQHVRQGDVIAILYSSDIVTAQNQLKVSTAEWRRVKKLGTKTVGEKRYVAAKTDYEKNKSVLLAYDFTEDLIQQLLEEKSTYTLGRYPLVAPHDGVILEDNFQSGQFLFAGSTIVLLVNEDHVWVEALLAPEIGQHIPVGTNAKVVIGNKNFNAEVIHDSHAIDKITRTRKIRLLIENYDHLLHAGLFANVFLELPVDEKLILLPETALMRSSDGDWTVFIEQQKGVFKQKVVELKNTINGFHSIKGLNSGQRVVTDGAFFLSSEIAKSGFDPHNH